MTLTDPDQLPMHINFPVVRLDVIKVGQFFLLALYCVFIGILLWTGFIPEIVPAPVPVKKGVTVGSVRMDQRCQLQWKSHDLHRDFRIKRHVSYKMAPGNVGTILPYADVSPCLGTILGANGVGLRVKCCITSGTCT